MDTTAGPVAAKLIAEHLLSLRRDVPTTPMSLTKLVYLCHGWTLGFTGHALINEPVTVGQFGPAIQSLDSDYQLFGTDPILPIQGASATNHSSELGQDVSNLIEKVNDSYGRLSDNDLSAINYGSDTPWAMHKEEGEGFEISNKDIKHYYTGMINELRGERNVVA